MSDKKPIDIDTVDADMAITLGLLTAVEREGQVTQRTLAGELGIALGLANSYLKRAAHKGWIKVQQVPPNRYAYYVTPQGFHEKARLTAEYLSSSLTFFRRAKEQINDVLMGFAHRDQRAVVLIGVSELAEIAALCQLQIDVTLIGIVDPDSSKDSFAGLPVARRIEDLPAGEVYLITDVKKSQATYDAMVARYGTARVKAPRILHIRKSQPVTGSESPL
ncbi:MAG: winged helix-turn-helix transcriptional regulator [Alphaproteobacteria bacterium]|nr:winged helix-turn-helix transcriptional regulator [Alphaproteobacteria bacterium]